MFDISLKTSLWVSAEIRRCDILFLPMTVLHRGDADRGLVLIRQSVGVRDGILHARRRDMSGKLQWYNPLGPDVVENSVMDDYIARQRQYDDDLWVLEVDDPRGQYSPPS